MRPSRCVICGDRTHDPQLVRFSDYRPLAAGMVGHPHGLDWFCARHVAMATRLRDLPIDEATRRMARRRRWWPFG